MFDDIDLHKDIPEEIEDIVKRAMEQVKKITELLHK